MQFRTEIKPESFPFKLSHQNAILSLGSCFSEHVTRKLDKFGFHVSQNPFGTSYNPHSLAQQLEFIINKRSYTLEDLSFNHGLWHSFDHYTLYSNPKAEECLNKINGALNKAVNTLPKTGVILITLGTAHAWKKIDTGKIVNNCHKIPTDQFERILLKPNEIINSFIPLMQVLAEKLPDLKVVFTVSPVRHFRDGATDNQRSKSILHVAVHEIVDQCKNAFYFPAYELLMDDLRDYRFYNSDLLHPSDQAVNYIWQKFMSATITDDSQVCIEKISGLHKFLSHRVQWPQSDEYQKLIQQNKANLAAYRLKWPNANWEPIVQRFEELSI
jgi:hypothetical protein